MSAAVSPTPPAPISSPQKNISSGQGAQVTWMIFAMLTIAFAVGGAVFWWPEHLRDQLIKTGIPADAIIVRADPTGNVYNSQPQVELVLEVHLKDGTKYNATTRMVINPVYIPQFQPGKQVHVRYDQKDKTKVAIEETENGQR